MTLRFSLLALTALGLSACTAVPQGSRPSAPPPPEVPTTRIPPQAPAPPPVEGFRTPTVHRIAGLEWLIERDARSLFATLGTPRLDVAEGDMRKLQFASDACVLDVFLYPMRPGAEPVATYVEARRASDGAEVDRTSCAQALRR